MSWEAWGTDDGNEGHEDCIPSEYHEELKATLREAVRLIQDAIRFSKDKGQSGAVLMDQVFIPDAEKWLSENTVEGKIP